MKAALVREVGLPTAVTVEEVPDLVPGVGQVVIQVAAASVNFPDLLLVDGTYQNTPKERPFSPGKEAAGRVIAVGEGVASLAVGERVIALVNHGAHAEQVVAPAEQVVPLPDDVDEVQAAAFGLVYATAWTGLVRRGRITPEDTVLITGAGGGVGSAGVELATAYGATVIALARDEERAQFARQLGADHAITASPETLNNEIMALTEGRGVDLTLESLGGDYLSQVVRSTAWEGRIVVVGFASGGQNPLKPGHLLVKNIGVMGVASTAYFQRDPEVLRQALAEMLEMVQEGRLNPPVDRVYPLEETVQALEHVQRGGVRGKIILVTEHADPEVAARYR